MSKQKHTAYNLEVNSEFPEMADKCEFVAKLGQGHHISPNTISE